MAQLLGPRLGDSRLRPGDADVPWKPTSEISGFDSPIPSQSNRTSSALERVGLAIVKMYLLSIEAWSHRWQRCVPPLDYCCFFSARNSLRHPWLTFWNELGRSRHLLRRCLQILEHRASVWICISEYGSSEPKHLFRENSSEWLQV